MNRRQGDIAEDAEPATRVSLGGVSRRPHGRVRVVTLPVEQGVDRGDASADRQQRDVIGARTEWRELAGAASKRRAFAPDAIHVLARVQPEDLLLGRCARLQHHQVVDQSADLDQVADPPLAFRVREVPEGLPREACRYHPGACPGVVPRVQLVPDEASGHSSSFVSWGAAGLTSTGGARGSGARYVSYIRRISGQRPCGAKTAIVARTRPRSSVW